MYPGKGRGREEGRRRGRGMVEGLSLWRNSGCLRLRMYGCVVSLLGR